MPHKIDKIAGTKTGQIESDPQDSFWSTPKQYPENHSVAVLDTIFHD